MTRRQGRRPKFLYTVPNYHNPAGVTLTGRAAPRDPRDLRSPPSCSIIEDNPYGLLGFDGETARRALRADDAERVIYLGSFSKTFASGFRVGWALAPHADPRQARPGRGVGCAVPPHLHPAGRARVPRRPSRGRSRSRSSASCTGERRDAMLESLERPMPDGCHWTRPGGRLLRLADPARRARLQGDAARAAIAAGWPTCPAPGSTPTATARTAPAAVVLLSRSRTGSARACGGWPPWSSGDLTCAPRSCAAPARAAPPPERGAGQHPGHRTTV